MHMSHKKLYYPEKQDSPWSLAFLCITSLKFFSIIITIIIVIIIIVIIIIITRLFSLLE